MGGTAGGLIHSRRLIAVLTRELRFPPPEAANVDGLLAIGGDLSLERLLLAYRSGIFPWPLNPRMLTWFSPDPRAIFDLETWRPGRSLRKRIQKGEFEVRVDTAFGTVMRRCAEPTSERPSTWIIPGMFEAYGALHRMGHAHSVETYLDGALVGGLYGVSIGGFFAGESMFSRVSDASKVALSALVDRMRARGMSLLDTQVMNPHLERLGAIEIPRREYLARLAIALGQPVSFADPL